jgi:hypothetical protein
MDDTYRSSGFDGERPGMLGMVTFFAVIGSELGLLAALLLGGCAGVRPVAAAPPAVSEPGPAAAAASSVPPEASTCRRGARAPGEA